MTALRAVFVAPRVTVFADGASGTITQVLNDVGIRPGPVLMVVDGIADRLGIGESVAVQCAEAGPLPAMPTELAGITVFLASQASGFITEAAIPVDGGYPANA